MKLCHFHGLYDFMILKMGDGGGELVTLLCATCVWKGRMVRTIAVHAIPKAKKNLRKFTRRDQSKERSHRNGKEPKGKNRNMPLCVRVWRIVKKNRCSRKCYKMCLNKCHCTSIFHGVCVCVFFLHLDLTLFVNKCVIQLTPLSGHTLLFHHHHWPCLLTFPNALSLTLSRRVLLGLLRSFHFHIPFLIITSSARSSKCYHIIEYHIIYHHGIQLCIFHFLSFLFLVCVCVLICLIETGQWSTLRFPFHTIWVQIVSASVTSMDIYLSCLVYFFVVVIELNNTQRLHTKNKTWQKNKK